MMELTEFGHRWPGGTYGVNCSYCGISYCDFLLRLQRDEIIRCPAQHRRRVEIDGIIIEGPEA